MLSMLRHLRTILLLAAAAFTPHAAAELYTVYLAEGTDSPALRKQVQKLLPGTAEAPAECRYVELKSTCAQPADAEAQAAAIEAGVTHLPCLVVADAEGAYATLLLRGLKRKDIEETAALAVAPNREQLAEKRSYDARLYLLFARCQFEKAEEELAELVQECRSLMEHEHCTDELQQLLGLRCLYPLLMQQYTNAYKGAHTPASEAKLLEAIAALEAARDLAPNTALGKRAHDERHRLRMARREARKYE